MVQDWQLILDEDMPDIENGYPANPEPLLRKAKVYMLKTCIITTALSPLAPILSPLLAEKSHGGKQIVDQMAYAVSKEEVRQARADRKFVEEFFMKVKQAYPEFRADIGEDEVTEIMIMKVRDMAIRTGVWEELLEFAPLLKKKFGNGA